MYIIKEELGRAFSTNRCGGGRKATGSQMWDRCGDVDAPQQCSGERSKQEEVALVAAEGLEAAEGWKAVDCSQHFEPAQQH